MQYTTAAIAMPWDVGKLLLQVQWVPREPDATKNTIAVEREQQEEEEEESEMSANEEDEYFQDPGRPTRPARYRKPRPTNERGYITRRSVMDDATRPEYIIPVGSADGVWGMIKQLGRFRHEGWLSLWKGLLTSCIQDFLSTSLQPVIHASLHALLVPSLIPYRGPASIFVPLSSHVLTGVLLSPLDLVRTRLIVQSAHQRYGTYTGPLDALKQISRDEGGIRGMYFHPHLLIPCVLDTALTSAIALALPGLLARSLGAAHVAPDTHPLTWALAEFAGSCVGLLAALPFETVRRRLQVQTRGSARPLRTCVETRPIAYSGVTDALWKIVSEERSDLPLKRDLRRRGASKTRSGDETDKEEKNDEQEAEGESWFKHTGVGQLYRGLGMRLGASAVVFLLAMVSGQESELGWTEL